MDGWTASVCTQLDQQQTFPIWTQEDDYDQQGNLLDPVKVKEGKRKENDWVLKQKLFDYVLDLKNKGVKVRAVERYQESQI